MPAMPGPKRGVVALSTESLQIRRRRSRNVVEFSRPSGTAVGSCWTAHRAFKVAALLFACSIWVLLSSASSACKSVVASRKPPIVTHEQPDIGLKIIRGRSMSVTQQLCKGALRLRQSLLRSQPKFTFRSTKVAASDRLKSLRSSAILPSK